jgi:hypothetical protein
MIKNKAYKIRGSTSRASYYTPGFAKWLKPHLIALKADQSKDICFPLEKYKVSLWTLYLRIRQAWMWILDNDDPDGEFLDLYNFTTVNRETDKLTVRWKSQVLTQPQKIDRRSGELEAVAVKWKYDLEDYINNGEDNTTYEQSDVLFTEADIVYIKVLCTSQQIAIIKLNKKGFKVMKNEKLRKEMVKE